jgi:hypothetical protein
MWERAAPPRRVPLTFGTADDQERIRRFVDSSRVFSETRTMEEREIAEQRSVEEVIDRLATKYPSVHRLEIEKIVAAEHEAYDGRPVRDFIPVLVEKSAKKRVKKLAGA